MSLMSAPTPGTIWRLYGDYMSPKPRKWLKHEVILMTVSRQGVDPRGGSAGHLQPLLQSYILTSTVSLIVKPSLQII